MTVRGVIPNGIFALAIFLAGAGIGQFVQESRAAGSSAAATREALVASAARTLGVRRCLPAIAAIGNRAVAGATLQDIMLDWDRQAPDAAPFFSFTGLGAGTQRAALTLSAIPVVSGGCAVLVERVSGTAKSCTVVAASELPGFPGTRLIDNIMVYQNPAQPSETYALIDNSGGCLVIRRQTTFKWPPRP